MRIQGQVVFDGVPPDLAAATIVVQLRDVSRADGAALVVAERRYRGRSLTQRQGTLMLDIPDDLPAPRQYAFHVHVDFGATGAVKASDYLTMESLPFQLGQSEYRWPVRRV